MKILAAIDQSEYATLVLGKAIQLAEQQGAHLTVLTVSNAPYTNLYLGEIPGEYLEKMRKGMQKAVSRAKEQSQGAHAEVDVVMEENPSPANCIVNYAEKKGMDLIVIGNKGAGAIERFLIGSVSSQVVAHAPCSVYVVKK